jgi:MFS family permease
VSLARRTFASLANPSYRFFFVGNVLSLLGFWIRIVVQGWLVYELTGSRTLLGTVTALGFLPFVILSPLGGVLADRVDRRRLLMTFPAISVAANVTLGLLVLDGSVTVVHIIGLAALVGSARAVEIPVRNAFVRDLVGMDDLRNAIALNAAAFNVARVLGPAIGAGLLAWLGMGPCFFVAAAANGAMTLALLGVRIARQTPAPAIGSPLRQLLEGLRHVRGHRRTRTVMLLFAITLLFTWTYQTVLPAYAKDRLGMGESGYALLASVIGVGALVGALWVAGRAGSGTRPVRRHVVYGLVWAGGLCVFVLGFVDEVRLALPLLALAGFCQVGFMATANGMVQESVPDALRGRVMGLWTFTFGVCFPIGSQLMGLASQAFSIRAAWSGGAVLMVLASLVVYRRMPPRSVAEAEAAAARAAHTTEEGPVVTDPVG